MSKQGPRPRIGTWSERISSERGGIVEKGESLWRRTAARAGDRVRVQSAGVEPFRGLNGWPMSVVDYWRLNIAARAAYET
jgi:hypothetical protein